MVKGKKNNGKNQSSDPEKLVSPNPLETISPNLAETSSLDPIESSPPSIDSKEQMDPSDSCTTDGMTEETEEEFFGSCLDGSIVKLDEETLPPKIDTRITAKQVIEIIKVLSISFTIDRKDYSLIFSLIYLLFLKGAANRNSSGSLSASLVIDGEEVRMTKDDLLSAYQSITRNIYLRRLAEFLASNISKFAEANGYSGDIFPKVNALLNRNEPPLTPAERAWCSSFNQKNEDCYRMFPRVATLLAMEYRYKFLPNPIRINQGKEEKKSIPRKKGKKNQNPKKDKGKDKK